MPLMLYSHYRIPTAALQATNQFVVRHGSSYLIQQKSLVCFPPHSSDSWLMLNARRQHHD